jgi:hypothetical protein
MKGVIMQISSINYNTPNFQARIKIDKNKVKAGLMASGATSSGAASSVIYSAGLDMPKPANILECAVDTAVYSGMFGSGASAYKLLEKADKLLQKGNKNIPS